jgi:hypothetical protein
MGAFAEFERALIRECQREGIALAKQRGAYKGRKKTLTPERAAELVQRAAGGVPKSVLARDYGISRETCISTYGSRPVRSCSPCLPRPKTSPGRPVDEASMIGVPRNGQPMRSFRAGGCSHN